MKFHGTMRTVCQCSTWRMKPWTLTLSQIEECRRLRNSRRELWKDKEILASLWNTDNNPTRHIFKQRACPSMTNITKYSSIMRPTNQVLETQSVKDATHKATQLSTETLKECSASQVFSILTGLRRIQGSKFTRLVHMAMWQCKWLAHRAHEDLLLMSLILMCWESLLKAWRTNRISPSSA